MSCPTSPVAKGKNMNSSRFLAFYDAVLAIVMTILVLSFNIPDPDSWQNIARMIPGFVCYAASFFWLGLTQQEPDDLDQHVNDCGPRREQKQGAQHRLAVVPVDGASQGNV